MTLKELDLHLTNSCSLHCVHCVFSSGDRPLPELGTARIASLIDEFAGLSNSEGTVNLFGGEVLLRKDIFDIVQAIRKRGLSVGITTNCNVPQTILDRVLQQDIQRLTADLDGATPAVHDWLRNREGNFKAVLCVLRQSVARSIFTTINSVLHTENVHEVEDILQICAEIGVQGLAFYYLTPTGRGVEIAHRCIDARQWMAARARAAAWIRHHTLSFPVVWEEAYEFAGSDPTGPWRCEEGYTESVFIRCDGEVYSCALLEGAPCSMGNLHDDTLSIILTRRAERAFAHGSGCPALAFHVTSDIKQTDPRTAPPGISLGCPYNCRVLHQV